MSDRTPLALVPLGTNGFYPSHGRQTMSYLLASPGSAVLLDAGSGLARLGEPDVAARLEGVDAIDVVLSHYHLDHVIGLSFLTAVAGGRRVRIHAPAPPLTQFGSEALDRLLAPPLFPVPLHRWPIAVEVRPYSGDRLAVGPHELALRAQKHPGGSVGFRLGDRLAYVTDTVMDLATIPFVRGVDTLLHEVWLDEEEARREDADRGGHSAADAVADLAREAKVRRLVPVHHRPTRDAGALAAMRERIARRAGTEVELPVEGRALEIR